MVAGLLIKLALVLNLASVAGAPMPVVVGQASAQATPRDATSRAQAQLRASQTALDREQARVRKLNQAHAAQLKAIDELKTKRASWNRDRKIRAAKADALATSQKLTRSGRELARLRVLVRNHRAALIAVVDAELKTSLTPQRQVELVALRSQLEGQQPRKQAARKIVLPDEAVDELADPEELEEQAALLAQVEKQLEREKTVLARREKGYERIAKLRAAGQRADELESFDGPEPRRVTGRERDPAAGSGSRDSSGAEADQQNEAPGEGGGDDGGAPPTEPNPSTDDGGSFADQSVVLANVVDASTADALRRADRSTDPRTKASAARAARQQVESRLAKLRKLRQKLQHRARGLRGN